MSPVPQRQAKGPWGRDRNPGQGAGGGEVVWWVGYGGLPARSEKREEGKPGASPSWPPGTASGLRGSGAPGLCQKPAFLGGRGSE